MTKQTLVIGLVLIWFVGVLSGLLLFADSTIKHFDPEQKIAAMAATLQFDHQLVASLQQYSIPSQTLVHITDDSPCYCDSLSEQHQDKLKAQLAKSQYGFRNIVANAELKAYISHYPALAVIGANQQLRYFGPYAQGTGCWVGDDTVDYIAKLATAPNAVGAVINSDVEGCFCALL